MPNSLTKEQRAHDLAVMLVKASIDNENHIVQCDQSHTFDIVKNYEHYYDYVLNSFESV